MSDMLQRLIGVEKSAAALVTEAEGEAAKIIAQARVDSQKTHAESMKKKAAENDAAVAAERARLVAEREARTREERDRLARLPRNTAAFRASALSFIQRGQG